MKELQLLSYEANPIYLFNTACAYGLRSRTPLVCATHGTTLHTLLGINNLGHIRPTDGYQTTDC